MNEKQKERCYATGCRHEGFNVPFCCENHGEYCKYPENRLKEDKSIY